MHRRNGVMTAEASGAIPGNHPAPEHVDPGGWIHVIPRTESVQQFILSLPQPERLGTLAVMRSFFGALLLLVQFGPLAGAGMCMRASLQPAAECSMPMADMTHQHDRQRSSSTQDCGQMVICAPATPIVPQVAIQPFGSSLPTHTNFSPPTSLFAGDAVAPPQPPPIV